MLARAFAATAGHLQIRHHRVCNPEKSRSRSQAPNPGGFVDFAIDFMWPTRSLVIARIVDPDLRVERTAGCGPPVNSGLQRPPDVLLEVVGDRINRSHADRIFS